MRRGDEQGARGGAASGQYAPASWMLALALTVLLTVAALTAIPALAATRRPVADAL